MTQWVKDNDFVNKFLFIPPAPSYKKSDFKDTMMWLGSKGDRFPCLLLRPPSKGTYYVMIYFHGNACDLGLIGSLLWSITKRLQVVIVAPEYPGYGLSEGATPCESSVKHCAKLTLEFVVNKLNVPLERIVIFGTSIGTGAACWLASKVLEKKQELGALVLQSAFVSIKAIVKEVSIFESNVANFFAQVGSNFIADRFMNLQAVKGLQYPLLLIHGHADELIPSSHSKILFDASSADLKQLVLFPNVGHNNFDWNLVIKKLARFLERVKRYYRHEAKIGIQVTPSNAVALSNGQTGNVDRNGGSMMIGSTCDTTLGSQIGVAQSLSPETKEDLAQSLSGQHVIFPCVRSAPIPPMNRDTIAAVRSSNPISSAICTSRKSNVPQIVPSELSPTHSPMSTPVPISQIPSIHQTEPSDPDNHIPVKKPQVTIQRL